MQATYKMIGTDGVEYGPVGLIDFKSWVQEGRVDGGTHVLRSDQESWTTAASFPELGVTDRVGGAADHVGGASGESIMADAAEAADLEAKIRSCGSWFFWIAALTLINSAVTFCGGQWGFYLGFSAVQALDFAVAESSLVARGIVFAFDLFVVIAFTGVGIFACRRQAWAFSVGVVLYGLDTALTLLAVFFGGSIIALALHAWAFISLIIGIKAVIHWKKLQRLAIG